MTFVLAGCAMNLMRIAKMAPPGADFARPSCLWRKQMTHKFDSEGCKSMVKRSEVARLIDRRARLSKVQRKQRHISTGC